jgi:hypothetical protein
MSNIGVPGFQTFEQRRPDIGELGLIDLMADPRENIV